MNQSMPAVQKCLGKIAFLLFGHTITEKCFYATCTANQSLKSPQKKKMKQYQRCTTVSWPLFAFCQF